jgi:hypothetical protein
MDGQRYIACAVLRRGLNINAGKQDGEFIYESLQIGVRVRNVAARNALDDDSEHLRVRQLSLCPPADLADECPDVHGEMSVLVEPGQKVAEVFLRSDLDSVHIANRAEFPDIQVEEFGLCQDVCGGGHDVTMDANRGPLALLLRFKYLECKGPVHR